MEVANFGPAYEARPLRGSGDADAGLTRMKEAQRRLKDHSECERCRSRPSVVAVGEARGYVATCDVCNRTEKLDREERSTRPGPVRSRPPTTRSPRTPLTRPASVRTRPVARASEPEQRYGSNAWNTILPYRPAIKGLAAPVNQTAIGQKERFAPGAFAKAVALDSPEVWVGHNPRRRIEGRVDLNETAEGLQIHFTPLNDRLRFQHAAHECRYAGWSVAGHPTKAYRDADGVTIVTEWRLTEISLIEKGGPPPAYRGTYVLPAA